MLTKIKAWWNSLSHQKQAAIVTFASAAGASLIHAFEDLGVANCTTWSCVFSVVKLAASPHMIATAVFAGAAALKLFYMVPNRGLPSQPAN